MVRVPEGQLLPWAHPPEHHGPAQQRRWVNVKPCVVHGTGEGLFLYFIILFQDPEEKKKILLP